MFWQFIDLPVDGVAVPAIRFDSWRNREVFMIANLEWKIGPEFLRIFHLLTNVLNQFVQNCKSREKMSKFARTNWC